MPNNSITFEEIFARRIPHIIGMYIATVWLAVEIADWMSERFSISDQFSTYVFVGMLTFIPSVIMLAWGHGRPGKDQWSKSELTWLPMNLVISLFAINYFVVRPDNSDLNKTIFEVQPIASQLPISNINKNEITNSVHQNLISFFWENQTGDNAYDWLSYGSAWLFSQDVKRTPSISVNTPYDSKAIINELKKKGFENGLNLPLSLSLQVANNHRKKWMVVGAFTQADGVLTFDAKLYNVESGEVEKLFTATHVDMLKALDKISNNIGKYLLEAENGDSNIIPDLAIEDHTSKNLEAIKHLIAAQNKVAFENDYQGAIEELLMALELDNSFAEANMLATSYYRAQGDFPNAIEQSKKALSLDYKIYEESVYAIKANLFGMSGEQNKALLVLENWAKVFPTSPLAHATLARKYLFSNDQLKNAEAEFEKLLSLDSDNQETLINLGRIYRVQGEKEKTIQVLEKYLEANPSKIKSYMELADAYQQFSEFDKAIKMYEQASIHGGVDYEAEIGIARTMTIQGDYNEALIYVDKYLSPDNTTSEKLYLLNAKTIIYMQTGQVDFAYATLEKMDELAKQVLPPLSYLFSIDGNKIRFLIMQGKFDQALEYAERLRQNTKPPFKDISGVFFIEIYKSMDNKEMFEKELRNFETFLNSFPMDRYDSSVLAWNAKLSYWNGDIEKSIGQLDQAILASKKSILGLYLFDAVDEFIYSKALGLYELGEIDKAQSELDAILYRNPIFAKAHFLKAKIYQSQQNMSAADSSINFAKQIWQNADENFVDLIHLKQLKQT